MDKRYQVFVSSTYADLKEERRTILQTLIEMDCIPAGMELFPAADEEQFEFIKRIIDDCDYYILIVGGRYGSTTPDGLSYTEKEYDYAREHGLRVLSFLHENPSAIPMGKSELDPVPGGNWRRSEKCKAGKLSEILDGCRENTGPITSQSPKDHKDPSGDRLGSGEPSRKCSSAQRMEQPRRKKRNQVSEKRRLRDLVPAVENIAGLDENVEYLESHNYKEIITVIKFGN